MINADGFYFTHGRVLTPVEVHVSSERLQSEVCERKKLEEVQQTTSLHQQNPKHAKLQEVPFLLSVLFLIRPLGS